MTESDKGLLSLIDKRGLIVVSITSVLVRSALSDAVFSQYLVAMTAPRMPCGAIRNALQRRLRLAMQAQPSLSPHHHSPPYEKRATYRKLISNAGSLTANSSPSVNISLSFLFKFGLVASSSPAGVL